MKEVLFKIGRNILNLFTVSGSETDNDKAKTGRLTNKVLLTELVSHFKSELEELSVGERMLYPMSFTVLMHPEDFEQRKESFPHVLPEVISSFYKYIEKYSLDFPNFTPVATHWVFQFSQCSSINDSGENVVEKGKMTTIASFTALDLSTNTAIEPNTHFSIKPQNSDPCGNNNINMDAIRNIEFRGDTTFEFKFDKDLRTNTAGIAANSDIETILGLADLSYSSVRGTEHFYMKDKQIEITGSADKRSNARWLFKIGSDKISNSHILIKYQSDVKKFQIATFGKTRVNEKLLNLSKGGDVNWCDLANNSSIFMNDAISVNFKITTNENR